MKTQEVWTTEQDADLERLFASMTHAELGARIGRTEQAVRTRCWQLGYRKAFTDWSDDDVQTLIAWYRERDGKPLELWALAAKLGRPKTSVCQKARGLGLSNHRRTRVEKIDGRYPSARVPKYATKAERSQALSEIRKRHIAEHGHPRGALGMKHTAEAKASMVAATRRYWDGITPEQQEQRRVRQITTNIERYGTGAPGMLTVTNPYSRGVKGYALDIGRVFFRSMWEANYCRYLDWLKDQGEIIDWEYEAERFVFHGVTRAPVTYLPDFKVTERDGSVVYHEVKGWMDSQSKSKLKRMAKFYPEVRVIVVDEDGYKAIARSVAPIVPYWGEPLVSKEKLDAE